MDDEELEPGENENYEINIDPPQPQPQQLLDEPGAPKDDWDPFNNNNNNENKQIDNSLSNVSSLLIDKEDDENLIAERYDILIQNHSPVKSDSIIIEENNNNNDDNKINENDELLAQEAFKQLTNGKKKKNNSIIQSPVERQQQQARKRIQSEPPPVYKPPPPKDRPPSPKGPPPAHYSSSQANIPVPRASLPNHARSASAAPPSSIEHAKPRRTLSSVGRAKQQMLELLISMGFAENHVRQALLHVNATAPDAVDRLIMWLGDNPMSNELHVENLERLLAPLVSMGFTRIKAKQALDATGLDSAAAIDWLINEQAREDAERAERERLAKERERDIEAKRLERKALNERKTQEVDNVLRIAPKFYSYGVFVTLYNIGAKLYMSSVPGQERLSMVSQIEDHSIFCLCNPENFNDSSSEILTGKKVGVRCSDNCFIGVEANGDVHSNRYEFGPLMNWTISLVNDRDSATALTPNCIVVLESPLHNFLEYNNDGKNCFARKPDITKYSQWKIIFHKLPSIALSPRGVAKSPASKISVEKEYDIDIEYSRNHDDTSAIVLWQNLRQTYRLRALVLQRQLIDEAKEQVEQIRRQLQRRKDEERTCVICWDATPNTVLLECGHICVCDECGDENSLKNCPICRADVIECVTMLR